MTAYRIELRPAAVRALRKLDPQIRPRVHGAIALLAQDPRPPGARALRGRPGLRVRVGEYRITYTIADDVLLVVVVRPGHLPTAGLLETEFGSDYVTSAWRRRS